MQVNRRYGVYIPLVGQVYVEVEAASKKEAIDKAFEVDFNDENVAHVEWEAVFSVTDGNVCHAPLNEVRAHVLKDRDNHASR